MTFSTIKGGVFIANPAEPPHDVDEATMFCRHCGAPYSQIMTRGFACVEDTNVTGISHLIAAKKLANVVGQMSDIVDLRPCDS